MFKAANLSRVGSVFIIFILTHTSIRSFGQADSIEQRIILIGDAGKQINNKQPELELIKSLFTLDKKTTVIFLGDNVYPQGFPSAYDPNYENAKQVLDSQINLVRGTTARAYFIAGNHDWMQGRPSGWEQLLRQYRYIESQQLANVQFVPADACPGPQAIPLTGKITLVVLDSQWWLHQYEKPVVAYGCEIQTQEELLDALKDIVNRNDDKLLIFADHHPFITYGRHGGYYNLKQHIFPFTELNPKLYIPLPVIGSLYPLSRGVFGNIQDLHHPIYKNFASAVDSILNEHPYCIRVAGHEHNLQFIEKDDRFYIVSGGGSKMSELSKGEFLKFGAVKTGFCVLDVIRNGHVNVKFYSSMNDSDKVPIFAMDLPAMDTTPIVPKVYKPVKLADSATVAGNPHFKAGRFKKWLLGKNYRQEWTQPVRVKVFDIGKVKGGLKITHRGGGMQTKSLRLEDKDGNEYVLRSVEKFPDNTIPEEFRETFIKDAIVDGISASYPYAALSVPVLSDAAKVPHADPRLVYVPDDPRLGFYHDDFANTLCIFEEHEPGGYLKNSSTEKVIGKLRDDNDNTVDQHAVLQARLLDMFIMDFDRHEDQWRWGTNDTAEKRTYYPIPRDRDQAFFVNEGFIPKQVSVPWRLPKFQGFRAKALNIKTFNFNARFFDRSFLNGLNRKDWEQQVDNFLGKMTDSAIEAALKDQPDEVFPYSGNKIIGILKKRRSFLKREALEYYDFLARDVDILGSDKREFFDCVRNSDGSLDITVHKINKEGDVKRVIFQRTFYPSETREVRLYGMADSDSFQVSGNGSAIKIRIIGGRDKDYIINNASSAAKSTVIYDFLPEKNVISGKGKEKNEISNSITVNRYDRRAFQYDKLIPTISAAYNRDDGVSLGLGVKYIGHGFRKEPYRIVQQVTALHSLATRAFSYSYNLELTDVIRTTDLMAEGNLRLPRNTINFFGFGNESRINEVEDDNTFNFYRTRFDNADLSVMLRSRIGPFLSFSYGPSFHYYSLKEKDNKGRILDKLSPAQLDTTNLFTQKTFLGPKAQLLIDNRNNTALPSRGVHWLTEAEYYFGTNSRSSNFFRFSSDMSIYISSRSPAKLVIALRFGGGFNSGNYEFYQSQYLSGTDNLRGFRKYRFAGNKMIYNNLELRYKLADVRTYLLPGSLGILAFNDVGRVWYKNEISRVWHDGYGMGIWLAPANRIVLTASLTHSNDGTLPYVSLGFQF